MGDSGAAVEYREERPDTLQGRLERASLRAMEWLGRQSDFRIFALLSSSMGPAAIGAVFLGNPAARAICIFAGWTAGMLVAVFHMAGMLMRFRREFVLARTRSLEDVRKLRWVEFESLVGGLLELEGWRVERRGGPNADGGIDLVVRRGNERWYVQCKHWQNETVSPSPVRELFGVMARDGCDGAMFVTSGEFSYQTEEDFRATKRMILVDGAKLVERIQKLEGKLPEPGDEDDRGLLALTRRLIDRAVPSQADEAMRLPKCSRCRTTMFLKEKDRKRFWACRNWPDRCTGETRPLSDVEREVLDFRRQ